MECLLRLHTNSSLEINTNVLILILMECLLRTIMETTKKLQQRVLILILMECLLSTFDVQGWCSGNVLILILMECLLRVLFFSLFLVYWRLNPYSNGMLTQDEADPKKFKDIDSLNPYSNGMLTQTKTLLQTLLKRLVLILILMECLLRLKKNTTIMETTKVLILILMECLLRLLQKTDFKKFIFVLILILMECLLRRKRSGRKTDAPDCLNPYSNGMLTQTNLRHCRLG